MADTHMTGPKMRLCFISLEDISLPPGGIATYLQNICSFLAVQGHDVHVISRLSRDMPMEVTWQGIKIHRVKAPGPTFLYAPIFFLNARRRYMRLAAEEPFDLIHSDLPMMGSLSVWGLPAPPILETVHTTVNGLLMILGRSKLWQTNLNEVLTRLLAGFLKRIERTVLLRANRIISVSEGLHNEVVTQLPRVKSKCVIIPNGINFDKFAGRKQEKAAALRQSLRIPSDCPVILYLGRLMEQKRVLDLVEALPLVLERYPTARLVVVGRWNKYADRLRKRIVEHSLEQHVILMDHVAYAEIQDYYGLADVYALPSSYEGFPFTILEAMAAGVPVISTQIPGVVEQITHRQTGWLHPPADIGALAEGINYLLGHPTEAAQMADQAREMVKTRFTWSVIGSRTEQLFQEVIHAQNR